MDSDTPLQDRIWRTSSAYQILERRRQWAQVRRAWKFVKMVGEWLFVIVVVLASAALILFLLFGVGNPLP